MKITSLTILFCIILFNTSFAGITGKISGKVTDKTTGEALVGVNIVLLGTMQGAATDINGNYFILNIQPGIYSVKAAMIGYKSVIVKSVHVSADQTTHLSFELSSEAVKIGEVIIAAKKPLVRKDLTSTEANVSGKNISMLPVEDIAAVINLQAGVVNGHFRGGRAGEVKYLIDGVSVNDAYSGSSSLSPEVNSIQEVQVLTGTFNAEYGEALSGVVNQITKIASNKFVTNARFYTGDYITNRNVLYENISHISPKDIYSFQGSVSGPIPILNNFIKFFLSGRYYYNDGYIYGRRMFNPSDSSNFSANNPKDWYVGNTGDNKYVPMNFNRRYTLQGKLNFGIGSGQGIVLSGMLQNKKYRDYDHRFKLDPDGDYTKFEQSYLGSISYTQILSNSAFIEYLGSAFITKFQQYVYKNPLDPRYVDPTKLRQVSGNAFLTGGTQNWQFFHQTSTYSGKVDLTWQIDNINQIKTGIEFKQNQLKSKNFQIIVDAATDFKPTLPKNGAFNFNTYNVNPYQIATYLQDKIELNYLIVNIGVRFDYFQPDGKYMKDPNKINLLDDLEPPFPDSLMATASSKYSISPRLGISFPITANGAIHISYGHFFQIPPFNNLYLNPNFRIPLTGNYPQNIGTTIGNTNLEPQKTIMYEIGLQQALTQVLGVSVSAYYKDIRNLLSTKIFIKNNFKKFSQLVNLDYGSVKGITLSFTKRFRNHFGATLDYTFQVAKGSASDPNAAFDKAQANPPIEANKQLVPLNWDRRHQINFTLTYGTPDDFIASFIGKIGSGLPYTPSIQNQRTGLENSENKPTFFNVDFYLTKYFKIFGQQFSAFIKIFNLFDIANEVQVYGDTGRAGYTLELTRAQEAPRGVNSLSEYFRRPDFYSPPRQINIGASFSF